jgi:hypothetical protein
MEMKLKSLLNDVFYNTESPACFSGANNVYREAKKRNKRITLQNVRDFLRLQSPYTLHKPVKRRFPRNITKTSGIDVDWQADLADMKSLKLKNKGYTFILVCIDVLSRFAFAEPVKRKTPEQIGAAFEVIMERSGRKCQYLMTDRGKEFVGCKFQLILKRHDIQHHYATSPDVKCAIVERYIRTMKGRIWRFFTTNKTLNYEKNLQNIIKATNNSYHRTIGCEPASVTKKHEKKIMSHLYGSQEEPLKTAYKAGDHVRITKEKGLLTKGYQPNFTTEVFVVTKVLENRRPATHKLVDLSGEILDGIFYNQEIVRIANRSPIGKTISQILKSEVRKKELWHQARMKDGKCLWVKDKQLIIKM